MVVVMRWHCGRYSNLDGAGDGDDDRVLVVVMMAAAVAEVYS